MNQDRRSSDIWKHFTKLDSILAKRYICKKSFSYKTSVTNSRKHSNHAHLLYSSSYSLDVCILKKY